MEFLSGGIGQLLNDIKNFLLTLTSENRQLIVPAVFLMALAESIVGLSFLVPSTVLFLAIGTLQAASGGEFWPLLIAGSIGATLGDLASYAAGRYWRRDVAGVWPLSRYPRLLPQAIAFFERWGWLAVLGGKFMGFMRPLIPIVAGVVDMRLLAFVLASLLSSIAWAAATLGPGFGLHWMVR